MTGWSVRFTHVLLYDEMACLLPGLWRALLVKENKMTSIRSNALRVLSLGLNTTAPIGGEGVRELCRDAMRP